MATKAMAHRPFLGDSSESSFDYSRDEEVGKGCARKCCLIGSGVAGGFGLLTAVLVVWLCATNVIGGGGENGAPKSPIKPPPTLPTSSAAEPATNVTVGDGGNGAPKSPIKPASTLPTSSAPEILSAAEPATNVTVGDGGNGAPTAIEPPPTLPTSSAPEILSPDELRRFVAYYDSKKFHPDDGLWARVLEARFRGAAPAGFGVGTMLERFVHKQGEPRPENLFVLQSVPLHDRSDVPTLRSFIQPVDASNPQIENHLGQVYERQRFFAFPLARGRHATAVVLDTLNKKAYWMESLRLWLAPDGVQIPDADIEVLKGTLDEVFGGNWSVTGWKVMEQLTGSSCWLETQLNMEAFLRHQLVAGVGEGDEVQGLRLFPRSADWKAALRQALAAEENIERWQSSHRRGQRHDGSRRTGEVFERDQVERKLFDELKHHGLQCSSDEAECEVSSLLRKLEEAEIEEAQVADWNSDVARSRQGFREVYDIVIMRYAAMYAWGRVMADRARGM